MKLFAPVQQVAANIPWAGDVPEHFLRLIGIVDLSAGLGVLLPALTRIYPRLTILAAIGSIMLQMCAMGFHTSRGEYMVIPFNLVLIALAAFVAWGRAKKSPIISRSE
ncbi:DoxX family protein [Vibrio sp. PP-XX7]